MASDKIVIGVQNAHFATLSADASTGTTYAIPEKIANSIKISVSPAVNTATLYADNVAVAQNSKVGNITISLEVDQLDNAVVEKLLGANKNADGVLEYKADDQAPYVAFGFEAPLSGGGVRYVWLYKGKFNLTEDSYETQNEQLAFQTKTISGTFVARISDKLWKREVDSTDLTGPAAAIAGAWFDGVYEPAGA